MTDASVRCLDISHQIPRRPGPLFPRGGRTGRIALPALSGVIIEELMNGAAQGAGNAFEGADSACPDSMVIPRVGNRRRGHRLRLVWVIRFGGQFSEPSKGNTFVRHDFLQVAFQSALLFGSVY